MKDRTIKAKEVEEFVKSISCSRLELSESMIWARTLHHFGVQHITPSYTWMSGNRGQLNCIRLNTLSFVCRPNITVICSKRIDTTLLWFLSDYFKHKHCGAAGNNYMQIGFVNLHIDEWNPRISWSTKTDRIYKYIAGIILSFLAINDPRKYR
jgi:hypothetical protein